MQWPGQEFSFPPGLYCILPSLCSLFSPLTTLVHVPSTLSFNLHSPVSSNSYRFQTAHLPSLPVFLIPLPPILSPFPLPLSHFINPGFHPNYSTHFWPILPSPIHFLDTLFLHCRVLGPSQATYLVEPSLLSSPLLAMPAQLRTAF